MSFSRCLRGVFVSKVKWAAEHFDRDTTLNFIFGCAVLSTFWLDILTFDACYSSKKQLFN
jgi:hypothetical protein